MRQIINEQLAISSTAPLKCRFYDYKHFSYPWHFHSEYEIIYIKQGTGIRFVGNNIEPFFAGDILLIGSNLPHYMKSDDVYLSKESTLRVKGTIIQFEQQFMVHSINHYPHFSKIKNLFEEAKKGIHFPASTSSALIKILNIIPQQTGIDQIISLLQLLKEMSETQNKQTLSTSDIINNTIYDSSRIDKIISYLNKHYTRTITLDEIASFAAMNPTAFCRFFKSKTGKSFKNYILDTRINYACKLLLINDMPISQISTECGFETITHFNKTFKKLTTHTPTQYKSLIKSL